MQEQNLEFGTEWDNNFSTQQEPLQLMFALYSEGEKYVSGIRHHYFEKQLEISFW